MANKNLKFRCVTACYGFRDRYWEVGEEFKSRENEKVRPTEPTDIKIPKHFKQIVKQEVILEDLSSVTTAPPKPEVPKGRPVEDIPEDLKAAYEEFGFLDMVKADIAAKIRELGAIAPEVARTTKPNMVRTYLEVLKTKSAR